MKKIDRIKNKIIESWESYNVKKAKKEILKLIRNPIFNWLLVIAYAIIIFSSSSLTATELKSEEMPSLVTHTVNYIPDWITHFVEYYIFGILLFRALFVSGYKRKAVWLAIILAFVYTLSDEIHQIFVPERFFSLKDLIVGVIGASVAQIGSWKKVWLK